MDPNEFAQAIDQQGQMPSIVAEVGRRKALAAVLEQAVVTDSDGNPVDLNEAVPGADDATDDTDADTGEEAGAESVEEKSPAEA